MLAGAFEFFGAMVEFFVCMNLSNVRSFFSHRTEQGASRRQATKGQSGGLVFFEGYFVSFRATYNLHLGYGRRKGRKKGEEGIYIATGGLFTRTQ